MIRIFFDTDPLYNCVRIESPSVENIYAQLPSTAISVREVDESDIPTDRTFRNAWEYNDGIKVNVPKAKDITKNRLRAERKPLLEAQDILFQRALETGKNTEEIVKEKQRLRDITKQVDSLTSLDELKALSV